jgi:hypothetical protein
VPLLIAGVLLLLLIAMLVLLAYPRILTGHFCDLTFVSIEIQLDTQVHLRYRQYASDGTDVLQETSVNGHMGSRTGWVHHGFLGRPSVYESDFRFPLASGEEQRQGATASPEMRRRLLVEQGRTYRLREGERFVYFRNVEPNGTVRERSFEIHPVR